MIIIKFKEVLTNVCIVFVQKTYAHSSDLYRLKQIAAKRSNGLSSRNILVLTLESLLPSVNFTICLSVVVCQSTTLHVLWVLALLF